MRRVSSALIAIALGGCSFSVGASPGGDAVAGHDALGTGDGPTEGPMIDAAMIDAAMIDAAMIDAAIDAPPIDAAFDPATCPAGYTTTIAAAPQSRYRWITVDRAWLAQHQDCADDLPGATHLAVLDTVAEAQQIAAAAGGATSYQVGAAQAPAQATVLAGWYELTGEPVPAATWQSGQPNDNNGTENGEQNRGSVNASAGPLLQDIDSVFATRAVCECDGKPIAPAVAAFL
jgi:hypothetical protein